MGESREYGINGNTTGKIEVRWWQGGLFLAPATPEQYEAPEVLRRDLHVADLVDEVEGSPVFAVDARDQDAVV